MPINPLTATAADVQTSLSDGSITSKDLVQLYLSQITRHNDYLHAVIATAPEDLLYKRAGELDAERANGTVRGPLHGIPILLKDNIATVPELGLPTTCGSLALVGSKPRKNAVIIDRLLAAGAIILGKANLSIRPYQLRLVCCGGRRSLHTFEGFREDDSNGGHSNPGGSSSGSAVAVSAGFSPISIGTETMGSLMMPSDRAALYTIKPTIKLIPQDGIIPISHEADSAGPMAKSVQDLADLLDVLVDPNQTTVPKGGYQSAVTGSWGDIRIGILEPKKWLFPHNIVKYEKQAMDQMLRDWEAAYKKLRGLVRVVKPVTLISIEESTEGGKKDIWNAFQSTFMSLLEEYLASIDDSKIHTLEDLVEFNKRHAEQELSPSANNNQAGLIRALDFNMTNDQYHELVNFARDTCGRRGIDKALDENDVDILMGPGDGLLFSISGTAGYPGATLPLGYLDLNGRPFGFQIVAKAHQEALLIQAQSAWEAKFPKRQPPPLDENNPELL